METSALISACFSRLELSVRAQARVVCPPQLLFTQGLPTSDQGQSGPIQRNTGFLSSLLTPVKVGP